MNEHRQPLVDLIQEVAEVIDGDALAEWPAYQTALQSLSPEYIYKITWEDEWGRYAFAAHHHDALDSLEKSQAAADNAIGRLPVGENTQEAECMHVDTISGTEIEGEGWTFGEDEDSDG